MAKIVSIISVSLLDVLCGAVFCHNPILFWNHIGKALSSFLVFIWKLSQSFSWPDFSALPLLLHGSLEGGRESTTAEIPRRVCLLVILVFNFYTCVWSILN